MASPVSVGSWNRADWQLPRNVKNHLAQIFLVPNRTIDRGGRGILVWRSASFRPDRYQF